MKFNTVALTLATAGTLAAAQGHRHAHQHLHKQRDVVIVHATTWEFELDGQTVPAAEVCKGVADGTLAWADGVAPTGACDGAHALGQTAAEFVETSSSVESSTSSSSVAPTTSSTSTTSTTSTSSTTTAAPAATSSSNTGATGIDAPFPDGELDCSVFPSQYGAVPLDYLGLGGWSGVQFVNIVGDLVNDIVTAVAGQTCAEGAMCSYACPAGYQKSQWPSTQGATGQSVGGIQCQGGKLHLTNPGLSKTLCIPGVGGVQVQNTLGDQVAVCRTDYPGKSFGGDLRSVHAERTLWQRQEQRNKELTRRNRYGIRDHSHGCRSRCRPSPDLPRRCQLLPMAG